MNDNFNERDGTYDGRSFPDESEWLELELPQHERELCSADFVDRTLAALHDPTSAQLDSFAPPTPSADFVDRTVDAVQRDRRAHWRELLARYVAPEPSPAFVARTLRALDADADTDASHGESRPDRARAARRASATRLWTMPLLAAAAVLTVAVLLPHADAPPIEQRAANALPAAFATAHAPSPLGPTLAILDEAADPSALPNSGGDGIWLLLGSPR